MKRTTSRVRTRLIAVLSLIISSITFGSGLMVFLYMKSTAFENQLLEQVMKNMDWIIENEFEKKVMEDVRNYITDIDNIINARISSKDNSFPSKESKKEKRRFT